MRWLVFPDCRANCNPFCCTIRRHHNSNPNAVKSAHTNDVCAIENHKIANRRSYIQPNSCTDGRDCESDEGTDSSSNASSVSCANNRADK